MSGDFRDLKVYQLAYQLAMEVFHISRNFQKKRRDVLVDRPD
jgi:hypothetical protein